ncbi:serine/threonine-protein kinase [Gandjariella thermophila]|uniref:serine/threonine-protein kinase n=1 Tax=Gandjariella thermophila TaxID=1931992 RepID=UPI0021F29609|nr:serine/threonine-protein kinase [Gandjariella thermophila]
MPPADLDHPTGRLIAGRYRLQRVLGRGSMGTVWAAYDEVLHRRVAVKEMRLPPGMPETEAAALRERTLREARAIAVLSHPNVVTLHDVVQQDGEPVVVMELVPSRSLAELLRTHGALSAAQAAAVADAVAAALQAAHRSGITHRDVKPGNVLVGANEQIKLTDFGIARNVSEVTMTTTGIMLGTPAFIAPEVAAGGAVSPAADLWGLGATLFAAVEGHPPYDADGDPLATVTQVVHGEVPRPASTGPLAEVIEALMVKDPRARMPLVEVRRRIYPLLPEPGTSVFAPLDLEEPTELTRPATAELPAFPPPRPAPVDPDAPLAADPGPLPFAPSTPSGSWESWAPSTSAAPPPPAAPVPRRVRRGPVATTLLVLTAAVLFAAAAGGGFALTRVAAGRSLLPPPAAVRYEAPDVATTVRPLQPRTAGTAPAYGVPGGEFTISVPQDWTMFVEQRANDPADPLPPRTLVHFVSPDGVMEVTVERFPVYYPNYSIRRYLDALRSWWARPGHSYVLTRVAPADAASGRGPDRQTDVTYRTVETQASTDMARSHFVRFLPQRVGLWVIDVTVPNDQEEKGQTLFDQIAPTFTAAT